ncbi:DUF4114 domain-containing protein [Scytonema sp. UIC 10036]|uniref:DUF4114 domain-containing protein n=1 Tax=Scytonema sp. UIC 10036 TaxID=2304196 RepID=UPI0012DABD30|nr:DUF4114 domain-containing protein [Scytonema sp. UIC 10036]MUG96320.1 DUF4114 domain-containing protein [Scytonema sp. UIC 10036]
MNNAHISGNNLLIKSSLTLDATELTALEQALLLTQGYLQSFANDHDFSQKMAVAFGEGAKIDTFGMAWLSQDFSDFPEIEIRHAADINGVNGAFATATNQIYLSQDFLKINIDKPEAIASVLLEEIGHFIDAQINSADSLGDEGAIFSALVRGESLSHEQLAFMQAEDDTFVLADGTEIEAATLKVDTLVDENDGNYSAGDLSLREAISLATPGDTITFANSGTIALTLGQLNINKALTINGDIDGNGTPDITVSGNKSSLVLRIDDGDFNKQSAVNISGLIIKEGRPTSAIYTGGGIINYEHLTLNRSTVTDNVSRNSGAGIFNLGTLTLNNSTISNNHTVASEGWRGGGIYNYHYSGTSTVIVNNSTISGNSALDGGGVHNDFGTFSLNNSTISGNLAFSHGGGIANGPTEYYSEQYSTFTISNSIISGNSSHSDGGGIYNGPVLGRGDEIQLKRNSLLRTLTVINSTISGNSTIGSNVITRDGGGIFNFAGTVSLKNSTISGNIAADDGGGIANAEGTVNLSNGTLSNNSASGDAGGIDNFDKLNIRNSTLSGNSGTYVGGINNHNTATLANSIIGGNLGFTKDFLGVTPKLEGVNLIADGSVKTITVNGKVYEVINNNPRLGPLQNNGGATFTHQLLAGSPAINAGDNTVAQDTLDIDNDGVIFEPLSFDQRGKERFLGKIDLGAFEVNSSDRLVSLEVQQVIAREAKDNLGQQASFIVTRNTNIGNLDVIINLAGSAISGTDYQFKSGTLNGNQLTVKIPDGQFKSPIVEVVAIDDKFVESSETIDLQISPLKTSNGEIVYNVEQAKSNINLEIQDNESKIYLSTYYKSGENDGSENDKNNDNLSEPGKFYINFFGEPSQPFTLFYNLSGEAKKVEDYTIGAAISFKDGNSISEKHLTVPNEINSLEIPSGTVGITLFVNVKNDAIDEDNETVTLTLLPDPKGENYDIHYDFVSASIRIEDNDEAGILIEPVSVTTTEDGAKAQFNFSLKTKPLENIVLQLKGLDTSEGILSSETLTFTPDDYDLKTVKTITITGVDDNLIDGNVKNTITVDVISQDAKYDSLETQFEYENQDNDKAGITLNIQDSETSETGDTAKFTVVLNAQPSNPVTIDIKGVDTSEGELSTSSLTFNSNNWNTPQTVIVTGVDDFIDDEKQTYTISFDASKSSDTNYAKLTQANLDQLNQKVEIGNLDNDTAGVTLSPMTGNVTEDGVTATFTVKLNSQPLKEVKIQIISSNETEGTVSPAFLSFNSNNFFTPQTVTVTGVNDNSIDGNKSFTISTTVISEDDKYKNIKVADFEVFNIDNDVVPTASINAGHSIIEGHPGIFMISLDRPALVGGATVQVAISGTATLGKDFNLIETIQFNEGETEKALTLTSVNDRIAEYPETITLTLLSVNSNEYIPSSTNKTATLTLNDNDVAGVKITARNNNTSESGGKSEIEAVLTSQPESAVEINLTSSNLTEGTLSISKLTFTPEDWNKAKTVTVTGVDDNQADGSTEFKIQATATSFDPKYNNITIAPLQLINQDNESFGVLIIKSNGNVVVSEAGTTDTYQIALTQPPTSNVQVTATADSQTEISLDGVNFAPTQIISLNDTTPRTVTVRALADGEVTGDRTSTIVHRITASSDPNYPIDLVVDALHAAVKDQDLPTVSILSTANASEESTVAGQFNLLLSAAAPAGGITINYQVEATSTATANNNQPFGPGEPDYFVLPGSIYIPEGATGVTIEVLPTPDDKVTEPLETVNLTLIAGSGYLVNNAKASNTVSIGDDDIAGVRITESGSLTKGFEGGSDDYTIRLTSQPRNNVEVLIATDKYSTAIDKLTFTPTNWNIAQTVTVNFVDDGIVSGDRKSIITHQVSSQDPNYQNIHVGDVEATVLEDETAGLTVSPSIQLKEGQQEVATYTLVLDTKPTANVTINFSPDSLFEAIAPMTFTPNNWNIPQNVLVTPVDDNRVTGNRTGTIIQKVVSNDPAFNNLPIKNAVVSVLENDTTSIVVNISDGINQVREGNQTDSFTIALSSQPASDVKIEFLTTSPLSPLTPVIFTSTNWNQPQTVNVVAVNDGISQGSIREKTPIRLSVISNDAGYNGFKLNDIPVDIADVAGVTVTKTSLQVGEGERSTTYQMRLNSEPYSDVTINFAATGGLLEAIAPITFNRSNWNQAQTITVKGVESALGVADLGATSIRHIVTSQDPGYHNLNLSDVNVTVFSDNTFLTWDELVSAVGKEIGSVPSGLKTTLETRLGSLFLPVTLKSIEGAHLLLSYPGNLNTNNLLQKLPNLATIATNLKLASLQGEIANAQIEVEGFDLKQPEFNLIIPDLSAETLLGLLTNVKLADVANNLLANVPAFDLKVERDRLRLGYLSNQSLNNLLGKTPGVQDLANTLKLPTLTVTAPNITIIDPATNPRYELSVASLPVNSLQSWLTTQVDALDSALPDTVQSAIKALANTAQDLDLVVSDNAVQVTYGGNLNVKEIINPLANQLGLSHPLPAELAIANPAFKILNPGDNPSFEFTAPRLSIASLQSWLTSQVNSLLPTEIQNLANQAQNLDLILAEDQLRLTYLGDINVGSALNKLTETLGLGSPFNNTLAIKNPEVAIEKNDSGDFTYAFSIPRLARADAGSLLSELNAPSFINSLLAEISNLGLTFGKDKLALTYNGDFDLRKPINELASALGLGTPISSPLTVSNPRIRIEGTGNKRSFELAVSRLPFNQSLDLMEDIFGHELPNEVTASLQSIGNNLDDLEFVLSQKPQDKENLSSQYSITLRYQDEVNFTVDIDDILGKSPAFIEKAIKAANQAFFGSENLMLKLAEPEISVATGPDLGFGAELNGKRFNITYDKKGDFQLRYELPDLIDFTDFAKGVPILDLFKVSDPDLIISSETKKIEDSRLSSITLVEGFNFIGTIDFKSGTDQFSKFINEHLGIESLGVLAGLGSEGASLAAVVPLNATLLSLGELKAILKNLKLGLAVDKSLNPNFGFTGNLELSGYDPFQNNEPTLFLSGNVQLNPFPVSTVTAGFALQTNSSPWKNPFGIPDSEIRNLAFELGGTYTFPFINSIGFLGDARFGNYDLKAAFSIDRTNLKNIALFLKTNQPLTLVDLLVGPIGSFALKQVGDEIPVIDKTLDLLDTILDVTVSGLDLNNDGENEPLIQFVPFKTDIAGIPLEEGFAINAQVDAYGVKGKLALNAQTNLSEITGSLALSRINLGGLGVVIIEGANNEPDLNLDIKIGTSTSPLISGDASVQLFGFELAEADFRVGVDDVDIKGKLALPGLQLNTDFTASNITKSNLTFSGSANALVFGNPIVGATVSGDRTRFNATGSLNLLGIPGVLQGNANATIALGTTFNDFALTGSGNLSIFNNTLANVNFSGNRNGISATGRLDFPDIPSVLTGGVNANVAIGNNDFTLTGSGNLSIFNNSLANVNFSGNRNGISATGRLNFPSIPGIFAGGLDANVTLGNNNFDLSGSGGLSIFSYPIANASFSGNRNALTATGSLSLGISKVLLGNINSTVTIGSNINNFALSGNGNIYLLGRNLSNVSVNGSKTSLGFAVNTNIFGSGKSNLSVNLHQHGFDLTGKLKTPTLSFGKINIAGFDVTTNLDVSKSGLISGSLKDINLTVLGKKLGGFNINLGKTNRDFDSFDDILARIKSEAEKKVTNVADTVKGILNEAIQAGKDAAQKIIVQPVRDAATTIAGYLKNGSIEGATIWFDANNNAIFDPEEPNTITQSDGTYILEIPQGLDLSTGLICSQGGIDATTGLPFQTTLAVLPGSNITPLSVLIQQLVTEGKTIDDALAIIQSEFGISSDIDLFGFDHQDETLNANPQARAVILAVTKVQSAVLGIQNLLAGAGGSTVTEQQAPVNSVLSAAAYSAVVDLIVSRQLNLEDANQVKTIIRAAATEAQSLLQAKGLSFNIDLNVIESIADEAAQVLVAGAIKKQILSDEASDGFDLLRRVTQAKRVSNGEEANALNLLGQGKLSETEILAYADTSDDALATIRAVTLLPQLGGVSDLFLVEGEQLADFPITVYDFETPQNKLIINITSDNEKLLPAGNVVLTPGSNEYTRFLNISPIAGQTGSANIKVSVTDSDGQTIDRIFVVTIEANKAPLFLSTGYFTVSSNAERGTVVGNLDANDGNGGSTDISVGYSMTSGNKDLNSNGERPFGIDLNGEIFVNDPEDLAIADSSTPFNLTVVAADSDLESTTQVTINVTSTTTNTPHIVTTNEDTILNGNVLNDWSSGVETEMNRDLTVTAVNGKTADVGTQIALASGALLTLNANGNFSYNPNRQFESLAVGKNATDSFSYTIADGKGGSTGTTSVTITGVNDAPTLVNAIADRSTLADTAFSFTFDVNTFTDIDAGDNLTYSATLKDGSHLPSWLKFNPATRNFSGTPTNANIGSLEIEVRATDNNGLIATDTFLLTVAQQNGSPTFKLAKIADDIFTIANSSGKSKLKVTLIEQTSKLVNEIGVFTVDDAQGKIDGIAPGEAGYAEAALNRSQVIFSALANLPNGFNTNNLTHLLEFNSGENLRFYLVRNSTTDAVRAGATPLTDLLFSNPLRQKITDLGSDEFSLAWKDTDGNSSDDFKDLVVKIQSTNDSLPLGTNLQGKSQGEVIDLRGITSQVKADFVINREADFDNFIGFYQVADENGGIDTNSDGTADIFAGQTGYIEAAVRGRVAGIDLTVDRQGTATYTGTLQPGSIFAPFMIVNGKPDALLDSNSNNDPAVYFPFLGANADKVDHIRLLGNNVFGFEDLPSGGDKDFNDVVMRVNLSIA